MAQLTSTTVYGDLTTTTSLRTNQITSITDNTVNIEGVVDVDGDIVINGIYSGNGSLITNLNANNISSGTITNSIHGNRGGGSLHSAATTSVNGFMSSGDKSKLDGIDAGAEVNVGTNLAMGGSGNSRTITSSTGNNVSVPVATTSNAGFMATGDKSKLDGIESGAQVNVGTNLGTSVVSTNSRSITSSTGNNITVPVATTTVAGFMSHTDKSKLDGIDAGAQVNVGTNLGQGGSGNSRTITSSTGTNVTISTATTSNAGYMSTGDKSKLDGIDEGAQVNVGTNLGTSVVSTNSRSITSSTGNNITVPVVTTTVAGFMSHTDKSKLDGIESGAQVNVGTNLGRTQTGTVVTITSSTGNNTTINSATTTAAGIVTNGTQTWAGNKTFTGNVTGENFTLSSDARLKDDITEINGIDYIRKIQPYSFVKGDRFGYGFIAQEIEKEYPTLVNNDNEYKSLFQSDIIALNTSAIKHVDSEVEVLKEKISKLEIRIKELEG